MTNMSQGMVSQDMIRQHFEQPQHAGRLPDAEHEVRQRSAAWGDEVCLMASGANGKLSALKWQAAGRPELIAAMSLASDYLLQGGDLARLLAELGAKLELRSNQRYLLLLVEDAFAELLKNFED